MRIATFNIGMAGFRLFGRMLREGVPHSAQRWPAIMQMLCENKENVDIWLLQAAYGTRVIRDLRSLENVRVVASRDMGKDRGLCILVRSDWPIDRVSTTSFKPLDLVERFVAPKGLLQLRVHHPDGALHIGNLHTCYDGLRPDSHQKKAANLRRQQMQQVTDAMPRDRTVLGGDFNFSPGHEPKSFDVLARSGWKEARDVKDSEPLRTWSNLNPLVHPDPAYPDQNIDMLLMRGFRGQAKSRIILHNHIVPCADNTSIPLSDHYGLLAEIDITGETTEPVRQ